MNDSLNPFLSTEGDLNDTNPFVGQVCNPNSVIQDLHDLDLAPTQMHDPMPPAVLTTTSTPFKSTLPANPLPVPAYFLLMKTRYFGSLTENARSFLSEFEAHMLLMGISRDQPQYLAAFRLQLTGPALAWYISLVDSTLDITWNLVRQKFIAEFDQTPSGLIVEEASFSHMTLKPGQALEVFHAALHDVGRHLNKSDRDLMTRFVEGFKTTILQRLFTCSPVWGSAWL